MLVGRVHGPLYGKRKPLDRAAFEREGVRIEYQEFAHPVYPQCGGGPFVKGLSSLDLLLNCGPLMQEAVRAAA